MCNELEQLRAEFDAFRQEVSDAVEVANMRAKELKRNTSYIVNHMQYFIIPKPDPLEKLIQSIAITLDANDLREALDEAGLEIREKGK